MKPLSTTLANRPSVGRRPLPCTDRVSCSAAASHAAIVNGGADHSSSIKVFVRVRPFNERERVQDSLRTPILRVDAVDTTQITVLDPKQEYRPKETHTFEKCFWSVPPTTSSSAAAATQKDVYDLVGRTVLTNAIEGFNGCIFAYGQTGSGKTYTMMGYESMQPAAAAASRTTSTMSLLSPRGSATSLPTSRRNSGVSTPRGQSFTPPATPTDAPVGGTWDDHKGIIPRITEDLFVDLCAKHKDDSSHSFRVELQYYEVYNEKVYDLLDAANNNVNELKVRQDPIKGPFVENLTTQTVENSSDIAVLVRRGVAERHTAATKMNERSSRSHAVMALNIIQVRLDENDCPQQVTSKVNLVDLAGSERTSLTGVEGQRFTEATKINLSLTTLGRVIDCLADQSTGKGGSFTHCPYRESNLTWLLMDSLGGNSKTTMIATVSPCALNFDEVVQTIRYASRARQIVNKVVVNEDPHARRVKELVAEVDRLGKIIKEAGMCSYTQDYVEELEESRQSLRQELAEVKSFNASLRCELDSATAQTKKLESRVTALEHADSTTTLRTSHGPFSSPSRRTPQKRALVDVNVADSNAQRGNSVAGGDANASFQRSKADAAVAYLSQSSAEHLAMKLEEARTMLRNLVDDKAELMGKLHTVSAENIALSTASQSMKSSASDLELQLEQHESLMAEHIHLIERLTSQHEAQKSELHALRKNQADLWLQHAGIVRDAIAAAEKEQRDLVAAAATQVRTDLRSLLFQQNQAAEKLLSQKIKEELQKKHAIAIQQQEEDKHRRLAELKEGFAKQLAQERDQHDREVKELKALHQKEMSKAKAVESEKSQESLSETQRALLELQSKYDTQQERIQKQIQQLQAAHEKEKRLLKASIEQADATAKETAAIAIADASAKSKASLEDLKRKLSQAEAERDSLRSTIEMRDARILDVERSMVELETRMQRKAAQLQEWQHELQESKTLELCAANSQLSEVRAARAASHDRHECYVDDVRAETERQLDHVAASVTQMLQSCDKRLNDFDAKIQRLTRVSAVSMRHSAQTAERLRHELTRLERLAEDRATETAEALSQLAEERTVHQQAMHAIQENLLSEMQRSVQHAHNAAMTAMLDAEAVARVDLCANAFDRRSELEEHCRIVAGIVMTSAARQHMLEESNADLSRRLREELNNAREEATRSASELRSALDEQRGLRAASHDRHISEASLQEERCAQDAAQSGMLAAELQDSLTAARIENEKLLATLKTAACQSLLVQAECGHQLLTDWAANVSDTLREASEVCIGLSQKMRNECRIQAEEHDTVIQRLRNEREAESSANAQQVTQLHISLAAVRAERETSHERHAAEVEQAAAHQQQETNSLEVALAAAFASLRELQREKALLAADQVQLQETSLRTVITEHCESEFRMLRDCIHELAHGAQTAEAQTRRVAATTDELRKRHANDMRARDEVWDLVVKERDMRRQLVVDSGLVISSLWCNFSSAASITTSKLISAADRRLKDQRDAASQALQHASSHLEQKLQQSDDSLSAAMHQHVAQIDGMLTACATAVRQARWHQEALVSHAHESITADISRWKSQQSAEFQSQLDACYSMFTRMHSDLIGTKRTHIEDDEYRERHLILRDESLSLQDLRLRTVDAVANTVALCARSMEHHHNSLALQLMGQYNAVCNEGLQLLYAGSRCDASQIAEAKTQLQVAVEMRDRSLAEEALVKAALDSELKKATAALERTQMELDIEREDHALVARECDQLRVNVRNLEMQISQLQVQALEADLLLNNSRQPAAQRMLSGLADGDMDSSSGSFVSSLVQRLWLKPSPSTPTPAAVRQTPSRVAAGLHTPPPVAAAHLPHRATPLVAKSLYGASAARSTSEVATPRGLDASRDDTRLRSSMFYSGAASNKNNEEGAQ